jgi:hypothetical protein
MLRSGHVLFKVLPQRLCGKTDMKRKPIDIHVTQTPHSYETLNFIRVSGIYHEPAAIIFISNPF